MQTLMFLIQTLLDACEIRLMVQKSQTTTWDGAKNPGKKPWDIWHISTGERRISQPSTVSLRDYNPSYLLIRPFIGAPVGLRYTSPKRAIFKAKPLKRDKRWNQVRSRQGEKPRSRSPGRIGGRAWVIRNKPTLFLLLKNGIFGKFSTKICSMFVFFVVFFSYYIIIFLLLYSDFEAV